MVAGALTASMLILLSSIGVSAGASAHAVDGMADASLILDINALDRIADTSGELVKIISDERNEAIRTIEGTLASGIPFKVSVYYAVQGTGPRLADLMNLKRAALDPKAPAPHDVLLEPGTPVDLAPYVAIGSTSTSIAASWNPRQAGESYALVMGAEKVSTSKVPSGLFLGGLESGTEYSVSLNAIGVEVNPETGEESSTATGMTVATLRDQSDRSSGASLDLFAPGDIETTEVNYRTFIPYYVLNDSPNWTDQPIEDTCLWFNGYDPADYSFGGDARSFRAPSSSIDYRTKMSDVYDWDTEQFLPGVNGVGDSTVVELSSNTIVDTDNAATTNMNYYEIAETSTYAELHLSHVANDPFCISLGLPGGDPYFGSIDYLAEFNLYSDGLVMATSFLAAMPSHEAYAQSNDSGRWKKLLTTDAVGLGCLATAGFLIPGCQRLVSGSVDSEPCVSAAQPVNSTLTDLWYISDLGTSNTAHWGLSLPLSTTLAISDARDLTDFSGYYTYYPSVDNIDGLEQAINLELFTLPDYTSVCSLAPIADLTSLEHIVTGVGQVGDYSAFDDLDAVTYLVLSQWNGSVAYLSGMTSLDYLSLAWGSVPSLSPLSGLTSLTALDLRGVTISDYSPLYGLTGLTSVDLRASGASPGQVSALQAALPGAYIDY
jgi:hypothetical protein